MRLSTKCGGRVQLDAVEDDAVDGGRDEVEERLDSPLVPAKRSVVVERKVGGEAVRPLVRSSSIS